VCNALKTPRNSGSGNYRPGMCLATIAWHVDTAMCLATTSPSMLNIDTAQDWRGTLSPRPGRLSTSRLSTCVIRFACHRAALSRVSMCKIIMSSERHVIVLLSEESRYRIWHVIVMSCHCHVMSQLCSLEGLTVSYISHVDI